MDFFKFRHPFTCMVSGPTMSGKTILVRRILKNFKLLTTINSQNLNVLWCYGQWQSLFNEPIDQNISVKLESGLPVEEDLKETQIIVIDDLMSELGDNKKFSDLFTKGCHHRNISVIFISQNLYHQGKVMTTIRRNCLYNILMKSPKAKFELALIGREVFPGKKDYLIKAYEDATKNSPYSYIRIDFTQQTPEQFRVYPDSPLKKIIIYCLQ